MNTKERREITLKHRQRHIEALQALGFTQKTLHAIKRVENGANRLATDHANGDIDESAYDRGVKHFTKHIERLFGGTVPKGFFINGDPRGYALKIDPDAWKVSDDARENYDAQPIKYTDWGGYMILAPEEF